MNSAAAIIEALNARAAPPARLREAARASWSSWLDRWAQRPGHVSGAPAESLVAELAAREPAPAPRRSIELNRWQAFATLWRQNWQPGASDERPWRWTAGGVSFVWNVTLAILLLIITALRFSPPAPPEDEDVVQVEYIGEGTPADAGGGPAPSPAASRASESPAASAGAAASVAAAAASAATAAATADVASSPTPVPTEPQPVQVSKPVNEEPAVFTLPPTALPVPTVEIARAPATDVRVVPIPDAVEAPRVAVPTPRVDVSPLTATAPDVAARAIPDPVRATAPTASVPTARVDARAETQAVDVQARAIPAPAASPAASASTSGTAPARADTAASSDSTSAAATPRAGHGPVSAKPSAGVGVGPKATPAPGAWPSARRADDWGDSDRNRPGNSLFDGDGRPRLADGPGSASAGHPPGMITQEIRDIDRAGTWLRRKPLPYEPTRWDRVWKPNQTLLDDWVDKGIKQVGIPIPGTNKKIVCIVSILQLGGGCGVSDPDLNEQPANARPPPDVPFKPGLQSDNGSTPARPDAPKPPPGLPGLFAPPKSGAPTPADDGG